jgi:RNA polymerase primary sigma factor
VISYERRQGGLGLAELVCIGNVEGGQEVRSGQGCEVHPYAVVDSADRLQALGSRLARPIPLNQNSNLVKLSRTETALTQLLGRSPTDQEIADEMGEPVETVRALRRVAASELSLDAPIDRGDRDSASFGERFAGAEAEDIEETVESQAQREFLDRMFEKYLTERAQDPVPVLRLDDGRAYVEEIGSLWSDARAHPADPNRAFEKLRESPTAKHRARPGARTERSCIAASMGGRRGNAPAFAFARRNGRMAGW